MPYLDELRNRLKLVGGDIITEDWYTDLVNYLETVEKKSAVDYAGYVHSDLIPDRDAVLNLGLGTAKFKEIHGYSGYFDYLISNYGEVINLTSSSASINTINSVSGSFSESLTVQGKNVLKDEDPIHIASFYDYAKTQIEQSIMEALLNLGIPAVPHLLGYKVDYVAPANADIFATNLTIQFDGKVRVKVIGDSDFYGYVKFKPNVVPIEIVGMLKSGELIRSNTWEEFDFTVNKSDEINARVYPTTRISIFIYNIPEG